MNLPLLTTADVSHAAPPPKVAAPACDVTYAVQPAENGCTGKLQLNHLPKMGTYAYLDVVYVAHTADRGQINFACADFTLAGLVLPGGRRSHSLAIPLAALRKSSTISFSASVSLEIESATLRADYYDYFGLRSQSKQPQQFALAEQHSRQIANTLARSVQWFVTWKCNFACAYCWQEVAAEAYRGGRANQIAPEVWADRFHRLKPREFYLTGGEPSLYKKLPEFIGMLDPQIELHMNSNLGRALSIDRFLEHVAPDRFRELVFSLHPTECTLDEFFTKLARLSAAGYQRLLATMVLYPQNLPFAGEVIDRCRALGESLRYVPYVPAANDPVGRDDALMAQMQDWVQRAANYTHDLGKMQLWSFEKPQFWESASGPRPIGHAPIFCPAGSQRINVDDEGDVYVCMSAIDRSKIFDRLSLPHYAPIGNLFDDQFELLERPILCWESFRCSACDFQVVDRAWTLAPGATATLPLPE